MRIPGVPYVQGRNSYSDRDSRKYGIAIHCTSNTASARDEVGYATRRTDGVSGHLYVDDVEVIQSLDTAARAGHAGSTEGNDHAVAVEITGLVSWSRQRWLDSVAWDKLAAALAAVIRHHWPDGSFTVRRATVAEMVKTPKVKAMYGHDDMRRAWGGTTHTDPGPNFPWDHLVKVVSRALDDDDEEVTVVETVKIMQAGLKTLGHDPGPIDGEPGPRTLSALSALIAERVNSYSYGEGGKKLYSHARDASAIAAQARDAVAELAARPAPTADVDQLAAAMVRQLLALVAAPSGSGE